MMCRNKRGRRSRIAILALPLAAAVTPGVGLTAEDGAHPEVFAGPVAKAPAALAGAATTLGVGDRLKITFFEMIDVASGASSAARDAPVSTAAVHTFYQRMDLSGEYGVEPDGAITFPRLGRFQVGGRGLQDLQGELAAAFAGAMGRPADVTVTVLERSPVYVLGPVRNPGAYKHVPGMMVLHAVALAGGVDQGLGNTSSLIEGVREMERLRQTADELKRLLARRARLDAERSGVQSLQPSAQLVALAGEQGAQVFMATEVALLQFEQLKRQQQRNEIAAGVEATQNELEALRHKVVELDVQKKIRRERLDQLEDLISRGLTTRNGVVNTRSELADIEVRRQDYRLAIVQAEARLSQGRLAMERLALDSAGNLMNAIAQTDNEIAKAQQVLNSSERVAAIIDESNARLTQTRSSMPPAYEIVRPGANGPSVLPAQETSALLPGDVLKVIINSSRSPNVSGTRESSSQPGQRVHMNEVR